MTDDDAATEADGKPGPSGFPVLLVTLAIVAVVMVAFNRIFQAVQPDCQNTVHQALPSPDGQHSAILFERNCGTAAGFNSQVTVLPAGSELPDQAGNALVAVNGQEAGSAPWDGPAVTMIWLGNEQLELQLEATAQVSSSSKSASGVSISVNR